MTLVELMVAVLLLGIAIATLLWSFFSQVVLNENARQLAWATNDASRIMEQLRRQNSGGTCTMPSVAPTGGFSSWDAWLSGARPGGGGGKSLLPNGQQNELVVISTTGTEPMEVTVAVCWRVRGRVIGECAWNGTALTPTPGVGGDPAITESPAMLATVLTCRR